ncbi:MAG: hypothetical protein V3V54_01465, partial [Candidatus Brocadiales bacterium]
MGVKLLLSTLRAFQIILPLVVMGCSGLGGIGGASRSYSETFQAPLSEVWEASVKMFDQEQIGLKKADKNGGEIVTQWFYRESEKRMGLGYRGHWNERHRVVLRLRGRGADTVVRA